MTTLTRRGALGAGMGALAAARPWIARAQALKTLRFVPQADPTVLDPITSVAYVTRNHAMLVFDTLYGSDTNNRAQPQMVQGHEVGQDGLEWRLTLRDGLKFHDGTPVLARDAVRSIQRWWIRDNVGQVLAQTTDELSAISDRVLRFRLKRPFPFLPDALGKYGTNIAVIMPERLAQTDPNVQVTEMMGSGPFRYVANERVVGSRTVYERFTDYVPRPNGVISGLAGPKRAYVDRVEWVTMPDPSTASSSLQTGEVDWWENPIPDFWTLLSTQPKIKLDQIDLFGSAGVIRFNFLQHPTNNVLVRRAALAAISQADVMTAIVGDQQTRRKINVGYFLPGTPMASEVGLDAVREPPNRDAARELLKQSGYNGEKLIFIVPADFPSIQAQDEVVADALKKVGFNIDLQFMDFGTMLARANNRQPPDKGGWHIVGTFTAGVGLLNPSSNNFLRGTGASAIFGWSDIPKLEELRTAWFRATSETEQARICAEIQQVAFETVPYAPTGIYFPQTAYRTTLTDVPKGMPLFYGVKKA